MQRADGKNLSGDVRAPTLSVLTKRAVYEFAMFYGNALLSFTVYKKTKNYSNNIEGTKQ